VSEKPYSERGKAKEPLSFILGEIGGPMKRESGIGLREGELELSLAGNICKGNTKKRL